MNIGGMEKALVNLLNELIKDYDVTLVLESKEGVLLKDLNESINLEEYKISTSKNTLFRNINNGLKRLICSILN